MNHRFNNFLLSVPLVLILLILWVNMAQGSSLQTDDGVFQKMSEHILQATMNADYARAISLNEQMIRRYPNDPLPQFFITTIYMYRLRSYWDYGKDEEFPKINKKFEEVSKNALKVCRKKKPLDAKTLFCRGSILGTQGLVALQNGEYISAYFKGKKAIADLKRCLELDPQLYDAYLGLGLFEYYCAQLTGTVKVLAWIVGFRGDRKKGIEYVKLAGQKGIYAHEPAKVFLSPVYIKYENKVDEGVKIALELRKNYPKNALFIDYLVRAVSRLPASKNEEAIRLLENIIAQKNWQSNLNNLKGFDPDIVYMTLAKRYIQTGRLEKAQTLLARTLTKREKWDSLTEKLHLLKLLTAVKLQDDEQANQSLNEILRHPNREKSHRIAREIMSGKRKVL